MQRKHQIALATLKSKTRIEENLTSLAVMPEVDKQKDTSIKSVEKARKSSNASSNNLSESAGTLQASKTISVQRADKRDPVGEILRARLECVPEQGLSNYQKVNITKY